MSEQKTGCGLLQTPDFQLIEKYFDTTASESSLRAYIKCAPRMTRREKDPSCCSGTAWCSAIFQLALHQATNSLNWRFEMNAKKLIAAMIVFGSATAVTAQASEFVERDKNFVSSKSRAEVIAELKQARENGTLSYREDTYPVIANQNKMQPHARMHGGTGTTLSKGQFNPNIYFGS